MLGGDGMWEGLGMLQRGMRVGGEVKGKYVWGMGMGMVEDTYRKSGGLVGGVDVSL